MAGIKKDKKTRSKYRMSLLLTGIILVLLTAGGIWRYRMRQSSVAAIDGHIITKDELKFYMELEESNVKNFYQKEYKITVSNALWDEKIGGTTPEAYLRDTAFQNCLETKSLFLLAYENGLIDYVDYDDFLKAVRAENDSRAAASGKGDIVYGVMSFTPREYLGHVETQLEKELKQLLSEDEEDPLYITETELKEYFTNNKEEWSANETITEVMDLYTLSKGTEEKNMLTDIYEQLSSAGSMQEREEICAGLPDEIQSKERIFTGSSYEIDLRSCYEVRAAADEMEEGEISRMIETEDAYHIAWLKKRTLDEQAAYETYRTRIQKELLDVKFLTYVRDYQDLLDIEINDGIYKKVKIKL